MTPRVAVIGTSLNPDSRSQIMAREALDHLGAAHVPAFLIDLRQTPLPMAGEPGCWQHAAVTDLRARMNGVTHFILAVPVYNYDVNAAAKNFVELMGKDIFQDKTVGFICAAGGSASYMSVMSLATSLMLDFRCWIVPRFVYALKHDVTEGRVTNPEITGRIRLLTEELLSRA